MKKKASTYLDRTTELIKELDGKDIETLVSHIIFMDFEIRRRRGQIMEIDRGIVELYEDIKTIEFLIDTKRKLV